MTTYKPMTKTQFNRRAEALFGDHWRLHVAHNIGCTKAYICLMSNGQRPVSVDVSKSIEAWESGAPFVIAPIKIGRPYSRPRPTAKMKAK